MKRIYSILTLLFFVAGLLLAQPPQAIKYKAIARDDRGHLLVNQFVDIKITLLQGSETGIPVYSEEHSLRTTRFGVMELEIGRGDSPTGDFASIDWGADDHFIKIEMDPQGHGQCTIVGTAQLLSVPYAFYAGSAGNNDDADADPGNELITSAVLSGTFLEITEGGVLTLVDLSGLLEGVQDDDPDPMNELQDISLSGTELSISEGSTVDLGLLPDNVDDADADPENEIQDLQLDGHILTITMKNSATQINLEDYLDNTDTHLTEAEVDAMANNNGYLTGVNWSDIPDVPDDIADGDDNTQLTEIEVDAMVDNNGYLTEEVDSDPANELQDININGHMLGISSGSMVQLPDSVNDADHDPMNELQVLSIRHDTIFLSEGGFVKLPLQNQAWNLDAANQTIINLADPINMQDAATKAYVDALKDVIYSEMLEAGLDIAVKDIDGNTYKVVRIGDQAWMAENLKTTKFNDGVDIPLITDDKIWSKHDSSAYCWYDNDSASYATIYGAIYDCYTIESGKICPTGFHVPTDEEWTILTNYLGGENVAGGKLKEVGTAHWHSPNTDATDEQDFTALPSGSRDNSDGSYNYLTMGGFWWSSTKYEYGSSNYWYRSVSAADGILIRHYADKKSGASIRCVKD